MIFLILVFLTILNLFMFYLCFPIFPRRTAACLGRCQRTQPVPRHRDDHIEELGAPGVRRVRPVRRVCRVRQVRQPRRRQARPRRRVQHGRLLKSTKRIHKNK